MDFSQVLAWNLVQWRDTKDGHHCLSGDRKSDCMYLEAGLSRGVLIRPPISELKVLRRSSWGSLGTKLCSFGLQYLRYAAMMGHYTPSSSLRP